jgi:hypothetical protein
LFFAFIFLCLISCYIHVLGKLTAYLVEENKLISVNAKQTYC